MNISVIGSGFSGLSAAAYLAKKGHKVSVYEKNETIGGRARMFTQDGFMFDMGPSWYWMPEVFEKFFKDHGSNVEEHYDLVRLDPSYQVFFEDEKLQIPADYESLLMVFERLEKGGADKLNHFLQSAKLKYDAAMTGPVKLPGMSFTELFQPKIVKSALHLKLTQSFSEYVRKQFKSSIIHQLLEFPILFLGSSPTKIPALYSMLNYADMKLGTWYPMGGMYKIIEGFERVVRSYGVDFHTSAPVEAITVNAGNANALKLQNDTVATDLIIAGADYHHVERNLLPSNLWQYTDRYWDSRDMAPSAIIMYLGVRGEIPGLLHHNLFFDAPYQAHLDTINITKDWPENPLFYVSNPSKTDPSVAPAGYENLFVLIPTTPGLLNENNNLKEHYLKIVVGRINKQTGVDISDRIVVKKFFMPSDFVNDYNAFKGNAYGLANTLMQTHFLKPRMKHKKINNLFFTGQLTVPGPGVPPTILSGEIVASLIK